MKSSILHTHFKISQGVDTHGVKINYLDFIDSASKLKFENYVSKLQPNQVVEVFYDANKDDGTLPQLAKIHKCIREIATDTGNSFEDIKIEIKKKSGLCVKKVIDGENYMICKSFAKCSKEELALAIESIIALGDLLGINFR